MRKRSAIVIATAIGALAMLGAQSAAAATIKVTNVNDHGPGSLRTGIIWANNHPGPDGIVIDAIGTIQLKSRLPQLRTAITIERRGAGDLSLRGVGTDPYVDPTTLVVGKDGRVVLRGLSIEHGTQGISNRGVLAVERSRVSDNLWGIDNEGRLTVIDSSLENDSVAIVNHDQSSAQIRRSALTGNQQGIANSSYGSLTVSQSTVSGNYSGITGGLTVIDRSTLSDNALFALAWGRFTITQSTLSGNASVTDQHAAIVGLHGTPISLQSTIVANSPTARNCRGTVISEGFNIADDGTCNLTAQGDQPHTEPLLKPLDSYGGPTETHGLRPTSRAVDAGFAGSAPVDQRGRPRIVDYPGVPTAPGGDSSDIGAFELKSP